MEANYKVAFNIPYADGIRRMSVSARKEEKMRLFAIGDLHLDGGDEKPMSIFGAQWENHFEQISFHWREKIQPSDTVLIPGDISWAMQLSQAQKDLERIGMLPGRKVLIRGNHDYWWSSVTRIRAVLPENMYVLQNDALDLGTCVVCGTRGWTIPTAEAPLPDADRKIYEREVQRLKLSLEQAVRMAQGRDIVAMMHYPPLYEMERSSAFTALLTSYRVRLTVYGHLHGAGIHFGFNGEQNGVGYRLVSCDSLDFSPLKLIQYDD